MLTHSWRTRTAAKISCALVGIKSIPETTKLSRFFLPGAWSQVSGMTHSPGNTWTCYPLLPPDPLIYYFNLIDSIVRHSQLLWCPAFRFQFQGNTVSVYNTTGDRKSVKRAEELCFILFLWRSIESVASTVFLRSTINAYRLQRWIYHNEQRNDDEDVVRDRGGRICKIPLFLLLLVFQTLFIFIYIPSFYISLYFIYGCVYLFPCFEPAT